jgi:isoleucyl-tRNA synthetase
VIGDFVVDDLSNWYVRRSRDRFWGSADSADARAAFQSLWEALITVSRLLAPFAPFTADWVHRAIGLGPVHLEAFPARHDGLRDEGLERAMDAVRSMARLGRAARQQVQIRVRQPLSTLYAVVPGRVDIPDSLLAILQDELNVKTVEFLADAGELVTLEAKPDFRALGQRFGSHTQQAAAAIRSLSGESLRRYQAGEEVVIEVEGESHDLKPEELEIQRIARGDLVVESGDGIVVALDPAIDEALRLEGLARELINRIQRLRRDAGLEVSDRIHLWITGESDVAAVVEEHGEIIARETLAVALERSAPESGEAHARDVELDGVTGRVALARAEVDHAVDG